MNMYVNVELFHVKCLPVLVYAVVCVVSFKAGVSEKSKCKVM